MTLVKRNLYGFMRIFFFFVEQMFEFFDMRIIFDGKKGMKNHKNKKIEKEKVCFLIKTKSHASLNQSSSVCHV